MLAGYARLFLFVLAGRNLQVLNLRLEGLAQRYLPVLVPTFVNGGPIVEMRNPSRPWDLVNSWPSRLSIIKGLIPGMCTV